MDKIKPADLADLNTETSNIDESIDISTPEADEIIITESREVAQPEEDIVEKIEEQTGNQAGNQHYRQPAPIPKLGRDWSLGLIGQCRHYDVGCRTDDRSIPTKTWPRIIGLESPGSGNRTP